MLTPLKGLQLDQSYATYFKVPLRRAIIPTSYNEVLGQAFTFNAIITTLLT